MEATPISDFSLVTDAASSLPSSGFFSSFNTAPPYSPYFLKKSITSAWNPSRPIFLESENL